MENTNLIRFLPARKRPWNKGRLTGQKPPLQPKHVWAIRTRLQLANKIRDLALFNMAIDSKLRGCDVVRLRTEEIAPKWPMRRPCNHQAAKNRQTGQVRDHGANQAIDPGASESKETPTEPLSLPEPRRSGCASFDPSVCEAGLELDREHRAGRHVVRHPFAQANEGHADLSPLPASSGPPRRRRDCPKACRVASATCSVRRRSCRNGP
jgi:hypothetical protein